jgi:hypothetical protein
VIDFHALRTTFVSSLVAAGIHPRVAQALARHSTVELTMKAYTEVHLLDLRGAVDRTATPEVLTCLLACASVVNEQKPRQRASVKTRNSESRIRRSAAKTTH